MVRIKTNTQKTTQKHVEQNRLCKANNIVYMYTFKYWFVNYELTDGN